MYLCILLYNLYATHFFNVLLRNSLKKSDLEILCVTLFPFHTYTHTDTVIDTSKTNKHLKEEKKIPQSAKTDSIL